MKAIVVACYNFAWPHETLKGRTPTMAAGLADKARSIKELRESAAAY